MLESLTEDPPKPDQADISLTVAQWSYLLQMTRLQTWPKKIGNITYEDWQRAEYVEAMSFLHKELYARSPIAQDKKRVPRLWLFGERDLWTWSEDGKDPIDVKDPEKKVKLRLDLSQQDGAY